MSKRQAAQARAAAPAKGKRKLTRAEKKQIESIIRQAKGDGKAHTAQQTIPYLQMYPDGICRVMPRSRSRNQRREEAARSAASWLTAPVSVKIFIVRLLRMHRRKVPVPADAAGKPDAGSGMRESVLRTADASCAPE